MIADIELDFCRWVENVWVRGNESIIEELFDEDGVANYQFNPDNRSVRGWRQFRELVRTVRGMFCDIQVTIEQIASEGNKVVAVCTFIANRLNPENEEGLPLEPVKVTGLCQMIFDNGKIVNIWNNLDLFGAGVEL